MSDYVVDPPEERPVLFGDIYSTAWLRDAFITEEAVPLHRFNRSGGGIAYEPLAPDTRRAAKYVLAEGTACRAIVLSDDCEIETWLLRKGGQGRLLVAAVSAWDPGAGERNFRRHPLPPDGDFPGGVVELGRFFAVQARALAARRSRVASLGDAARSELEQRWAAYATRRGPLAALDNATKLAHLVDASGDADRLAALIDGGETVDVAAMAKGKSVATVLVKAWRIEGEVMAAIATAHEARRVATSETAALAQELQELADLARQAGDQLRGR
ncbi:MAG: hypothetical protein IT201_02030 [Thermoleophilia bacterium]|nr:hypothetical protein [Thermoleophilia bacterium]